ncbi:MAG: hypothetical protein JSR26_00160 [Proteobacteria bacterium]|nr:hypothetical protein [Pseudomonadota bacterium]
MDNPELTADTLKARLHEVAERHAEPTRVRLHRAISWLARAERERDDADARFIFLWIAFNAAYARPFEGDQPEREQLRQFLAMLVTADGEKRLHRIVFADFHGPIRTLIQNRYVFEPFWKALREHDGSGRWEQHFSAANRAAMKSLMEGQTDAMLAIVFDRLYTLRNQLVHGGATWNSGVNREQVRDGVRILLALVPAIVALMLDQPTLEYGEIAYPVV